LPPPYPLQKSKRGYQKDQPLGIKSLVWQKTFIFNDLTQYCLAGKNKNRWIELLHPFFPNGIHTPLD